MRWTWVLGAFAGFNFSDAIFDAARGAFWMAAFSALLVSVFVILEIWEARHDRR